MEPTEKSILSSYVLSLDTTTRMRYVDKIKVIGNIDPYVLPDNQFKNDDSLLPPVTYPDIFTYFIYKTSYYTKQELKAYKSLEAYNQFTSGWVKERGCKEIKERILISGKVTMNI